MVKIGYLGDNPAAARLARIIHNRHGLHVLDPRLEDKASASADAETAVDQQALLRQCDIVFVYLSRADSVPTLFAKGGVLAEFASDTVIIDQSDGSPNDTRRLSSELALRNLHLIDAPMSGHYTENTSCPPILLVAGPKVFVDRVQPILSSFDAQVFYCGNSGNAHALNLLNNALAIAAQLATLEVAAMGCKFGLATETMADVISKGSGRNRTSQIVMPYLVAGQPSSELSLGYALEILGRFAHDGRGTGTPLIITNNALALIQAAVNKFGADASIDKTVDLIEHMAKTDLRTPLVRTVAEGEVSDAELRVGYVGLGTMGGALARRLMLSRPLTVFDVNKDLVKEFASEGATPADSLADLARQCDVIMVCVPTSAIVRSVIFGPEGLAEGLSPGKIVIDQTTGSPSETRALAAQLAKAGVTMIDAPVSGGARGAIAGTIAIISAGPAEAFEQVRPILSQISPNIVHCGQVGNGHAAKLVQNVVGASNRATTLECVAAACKNGLKLSDMIAPINAGSGWNGGAERIIPALRTGSPTTDFSMGLNVKDLRLATAMGAEMGAPMLIPNAVRSLFEICVNEKGASANTDEIAGTIEGMAGVTFTECA